MKLLSDLVYFVFFSMVCGAVLCQWTTPAWSQKVQNLLNLCFCPVLGETYAQWTGNENWNVSMQHEFVTFEENYILNYNSTV